MTRLRWALIVFIAGASLTNLVGAYKDHLSIALMANPGMGSSGYQSADDQERLYNRSYSARQSDEFIIVLIGSALLLLPFKNRETGSSLYWMPIAFLVAGSLWNGIHTWQAYDSRGWISHRHIWHYHVNLSGIERELVILSVGGIGMLLLRKSDKPYTSSGLDTQSP